MIGFTRTHTWSRGFTLLELLFVLFIIGVLTAIAVPRYRGYMAEARLAGYADFVVEAIRRARIEVLTNAVPVSLCASDDAGSCTGTRWKNGWIAFTDSGVPGVRR